MLAQLNISLVTPSGSISASINSSAVGGNARLSAEAFPIANDTLMNIAFPYATIKAFTLLSTAACTIETNATDATGGDTITLLAGVPKTFITDGTATFGTNLFTANVTKFYVSAAAVGTLTAEIFYDATP